MRKFKIIFPVMIFILSLACSHGPQQGQNSATSLGTKVEMDKAETPEQVLRRANDKLERQDVTGAVEDMRRFLQVIDYLEGHVFLAMCFEGAGWTGEAAQAWEKVEKLLIYTGKEQPFILESTLFAAAEHYAQRDQWGRSHMFLDELWRRFPASEWTVKAHIMVAQVEFSQQKWGAVVNRCADLRRTNPRHAALQICDHLARAAERMLSLGPMPLPEAGHWLWENPLPQGNTLNSVWVGASGEVVAVGEGGAIVQRGINEKVFRAVPAMTRWSLNSVRGLGRGEEVYTVGRGGIVMQRTEGKWREIRPSSPDAADVNAVYVPAPGQVLSVTQSGAIEEWRGGKWTSVQPASVPLFGIWGNGPDKIFVVGEGGTMLQRRETVWQPINSDAYEDLKNLWGLDSGQIVAVGSKRTAVFYDGQQAKESIVGAEDLRGVWGTEEKNVWAVGKKGHILHFNGREWRNENSPTLVNLMEVGGLRSDKEVWAVGVGGTILKRINGRWNVITGGIEQKLVGVGVSKKGEALALGERGLLLRRERGTWQKLGWNISSQPRDLWCDGERWYVVGLNGLLAVRGGSGDWRELPTKISDDLLAVTSWPGANGGGAVAVGTRGTVIRMVGERLIKEQAPGGMDLYGVWASAADNIYAVGGRGMIVHFDGKQWREEESGTNNDLRGVYGSSRGELWAVGLEGTILRRARGKWQLESSTISQSLVDIWGTASKEGAAIFVVSRKGNILRYDGAAWRAEHSPAECLTALGGAQGGEMFAVGCNGAIVKRKAD